MVKTMEIIAHQGFGEWVYNIVAGVYLPHLHNIFGNMLLKKMVAKCHNFLVQGDARIFCVQHNTNVVHKYRCGFGYLDPHWSKVVPEHNRLLKILLKRCEIGSKCWGLHHGMKFWWPCCGGWYHHLKQPGDRSTSYLVFPMVRIHKQMDVQSLK